MHHEISTDSMTDTPKIKGLLFKRQKQSLLLLLLLLIIINNWFHNLSVMNMRCMMKKQPFDCK